MPNATDNSRKMDFGMRTKGPDHIPHDSNISDFGTVEVVAEHTAQHYLSQQKWIQFAGYARFALHNQIDRAFIFGLLIHQWDYRTPASAICSMRAQNPRSPLPRNNNSWKRPGAQLLLKGRVIKISAIDTNSITTEAQLYDELIESGAWAVPLVAYSECGGGNKDTKDILRRNSRR